MWWWLACKPELVTVTEKSFVIVTPAPGDVDGDGECDGEAGEDADRDGWLACEDCDDHDPARFPGAPDPFDGLDQSCDGTDGLAGTAGLLLEGGVASATGWGLAFAGGVLVVGSPGQSGAPNEPETFRTALDADGVIEVVPSELFSGYEIRALPGEPARVALINKYAGVAAIDIYHVTPEGLGAPVATLRTDPAPGPMVADEQWLAVRSGEAIHFYALEPDALAGELTEQQALHTISPGSDGGCSSAQLAFLGDRDSDGLDDLGAVGCIGGLVYVFTPGLAHSYADASEWWWGLELWVWGEPLGGGDLDGDGVPEMVWSASTGPRAYVVPYLGPGGRPVPVNAQATIEPEGMNGTSGTVFVEDLDGDGQDDVVLGANARGVTYAYPGPLQGTLDREDAAAVWTGSPGDASFGHRLVAGDFDSDGDADLFLGAPGREPDDSGAVYMVYSPLW